MKTNASKTAADNNTTAKPFFNKSGGESLFSADTKTEQPFFTKSAIQANLSVGAPDDPYEQEAEKVSRQVMSSYDQVAGIQRKLAPFGVQSMMIQPMSLGTRISRRPQTLQAKCAECEQEEQLAQPKSMGIQFAGDGAMVPADIESKIQSRRGGGSGMDAQTKSAMETSFGADFSGVKVHTDSTAVQMSQQLNAHAFTVGNDIFFNQGRYQPQTKEGAGLLSHELTHTVQQGASLQNKRINKSSLLSRLGGHEAAHLSAMSGGASALNRQEMAQLTKLPEEEMTKMQQLQMLQMKGVDEVQKKGKVGVMTSCGRTTRPCPQYQQVDGSKPLDTYNCAGLSHRAYRDIGLTEERQLLNNGRQSAQCNAGEVKHWLWEYNVHMEDYQGNVISATHPDFHTVAGVVGPNGAAPTNVFSKNGHRFLEGPSTGPSFRPALREQARNNDPTGALAYDQNGHPIYKVRTDMRESTYCLPCPP